MFIIGLTGPLASGKTTALKALSSQGIPTFSADDAVAQLYQNKDMDKVATSAAITQNPNLLPQLEKILHPAVLAAAEDFIAKQRTSKPQPAFIVLEVPLLFTSNMNALCDYTIALTTASATLQKRALSRPTMTPEKFALLFSHQQPEVELAKTKADFIIDTDCPLKDFSNHFLRLVTKIARNDTKKG